MENGLVVGVAHMRESSVWVDILPMKKRFSFYERTTSLSVA